MGFGIESLLQDHGSAVIIGILRFTIFVPFGIYNAIASNHNNVIRQNLELHNGFYDLAFAHGEQFANKYAAFGFYWNFAVWIPAIITPAPFSLIFGVVDAAIAILISISTHFQTQYAPHNIDLCGGTGAHDWPRGLPPGANESFFEASARLNATATNSFQMCKSYVVEWQYGIVLSFFYSLIAFTNVSLCSYACVFHYKKSRRENKSFRKWLFEAAIVLPKIICVIMVALLYYIPVIFFRCLPRGAKAKTRYARRYMVKTGLAATNAGEVQLEKLAAKTIRKKDTGRYQGVAAGEPASLADFLGIYDILMLVVEDLHYADIVNLSLASKSVREAVLPAEDYERRLQHFRRYTCEDNKTRCWVCTNQICDHCTYEHSIRQTTPYYHLDSCTPYCSPCYKTLLHSHPGPPICKCAPPPPSPNFFARLIGPDPYYATRQAGLPTVKRPVCWTCAFLTEKEVFKARQKRTEHDLWALGKEGECGKCKGMLGSGPRWWICGKCKMECKALCHRAWGRKSKEKEKVVVGEEAV